MDNTNKRRCTKCKNLKPLSDFHQGKHYTCKPCDSILGKERRQKETENSKKVREQCQAFQVLMSWAPPQLQEQK